MKSVSLIYPRSSGLFIPQVAAMLQDDFEVKLVPYDTGETIDFGTPDVAWLEWAVPSSGELADHLRSCGARVILRTHRYEVHEPAFALIPWKSVSRAVFISPRVEEQARPFLGKCAERTAVLPNAVDTKHFALQPHKPGKRIGVAAAVRGIKQPGLWFALMRMLPEDFVLRICGEVHDKDFMDYLIESARRCKLNIQHDGWVAPKDMPAWWAEQDWCLSTSAAESQGMNFLEAGACGVRPLVHWFPGAEDVVRHDWIWQDLQRAVGLLKFMPEVIYDAAGTREFIEGRYGFKALRPRYVKLIEEVLA